MCWYFNVVRMSHTSNNIRLPSSPWNDQGISSLKTSVVSVAFKEFELCLAVVVQLHNCTEIIIVHTTLIMIPMLPSQREDRTQPVQACLEFLEPLVLEHSLHMNHLQAYS